MSGMYPPQYPAQYPDMYGQQQYNQQQTFMPYGVNVQQPNTMNLNGHSQLAPQINSSMMAPDMQGSYSGNSIQPRYAHGGPVHMRRGGFFKKALGFAAPIIGGMLGGPGGAALGGALGGAMQGGKGTLRNALIGGGLGYLGGGGFGKLGGLGSILPGKGQGLGDMFGGGLGNMFNGNQGIENAGGAGGMFSGANGLSNALVLAGLAAPLLGKKRVPHEQSMAEYVKSNPMPIRPQDAYRKVKPLDRALEELEEDEEGNPEKRYFKPYSLQPEYMAHGGYLDGHTGGQDDDIDAKLSDGEYVISADVVSALGDGNNKHGAQKFDALMANVRKHKYAKGGKGLPPKAKSLNAYMQLKRGAK